MLYRLFLYKTAGATSDAPCLLNINRAISTNSEREWKGNQAANSMEHFPAEKIAKRITMELTDENTKVCKCKIKINYSPKPYKQIEYIYVATSFLKAKEVLPKLHTIAAENDLALYDAQTDKTFYRELVDSTFLIMNIRGQELNNVISENMKPIRRIRSIENYGNKRDKNCSFAVTLNKDKNIKFIDRVTRFYECLKNNLKYGESLVCKDRCYKICGKWYTITYILEGYKKHADMIGYTDNGISRMDIIRRMGVEEACRWVKRHNIDTDRILARMNFLEMQEKYPNPADRFVASVNISKWEKKQKFDIGYGSRYSSGIGFHVVQDEYWDDAKQKSVLDIEEESATFILPFINDIYPYFYERYYLEPNHIPWQMWVDILKRLEEAKEMILNDTFNPQLIHSSSLISIGLICMCLMTTGRISIT